MTFTTEARFITEKAASPVRPASVTFYSGANNNNRGYMAYYSLKAEFFVDGKGVVIKKAPPLKRSVAFEVWNSSEPFCALCGREVSFSARNEINPFREGPMKAHIDHILPRSRGGQNNIENLRVTCLSCNCSRKAGI